MKEILNQVCDIVWGLPLIIAFIVTHIFLTIRLGFIQKYIFKAIRISFKRSKEGKGEISHFGAMVTALAATIGAGNIIGVATAVTAGGPGAVFWMWLTGVFGIATKYSEALLSVKYRVIHSDGTISGGPMYVLEKAMNAKWLAILFAIFTAITAIGTGNMVQANAISGMLKDSFQINPWISGVILAICTAVVLIGGVKSIARTCEFLVPFMAIFYILGCLVILYINLDAIPHTIKLIVTSAFSGHAAVGGFLGATVKSSLRYGIARGLYSNESGQGSAPIIAAAAQTTNPVRQALVSSTGTFWDTVVVCALSGIVIVNSGQWLNGMDANKLTAFAFGEVHVLGPAILTIAMLTFVFSTIIGWSYYGEKALEYLFGRKAIVPYRWVWVVFVLVGSVMSLETVWTMADIMMAFMAVPNLISLFFLHSVIASETKKYLKEGSIF